MPDRRPLVALMRGGLSAFTAARALKALETEYVLVRRDALLVAWRWNYGEGWTVAPDRNEYDPELATRVGIFEMPEAS